MTKPLDEQIADLERAIGAQEGLRATLGDTVVDTTLAALRRQLAELEAQAVSPGVAQQPEGRRQRKLATVLLADVSGFTSMAETMDAEEVSDMMNALWQRIDAAIVEHGGRIDKHIGDAVMALWGVDQVREDDPERAIYAALAMQAVLRQARDERLATSREAHDAQLTMRIGVNTGPVLLGDVGTTGEFSAVGDAVNLTERLERMAPVGGILISHDTYRHVRGVFDVLPQAPLTARGRTRPVRTYVVQRAKPRAFRMGTRGVEGIETRMVGRDTELRALQEAFQSALDNAQTRVVTITGEAGVGKSRLLYELETWLELLPEEVYYFKGRSRPEMQFIPHSIIRDMFAYRFEIRESDSAATVLNKFRAGMAGVLEPEQADLVGHLIGFEFSASPAVQKLLGDPSFGPLAMAYLTSYVRAMADEPAVIFLEDVHWADDRSLDLINRLAAEVPDAQLLIVCLARPPLLERRPDWGWNGGHTRLHLEPLSKDDSRALVDEILQKVDAVPNALRDLVVEGAEGNPFYVEELIKMLIEDGVIVRGEERWRVALDRLTEVRVPPTLTGVLQARLDSLPREEKAVLQRASVVGRLFWDAAVTELVADEQDETDRSKVNALLGAIRGRELVFQRDRSTFEGTDEYIFKHAILRDVTYETVLLKLRRVYHVQVARWLEAHAGERLGEYLGLIARHYEMAGETAQAVEYLRRSATEAFNVSAYRDAIADLERALALLAHRAPLELTAEEAETRTALLIGLGTAYRYMGDYVVAVQYLDEALALARARDDKGSIATALHNFSDIAYRQGDSATAMRYARESLAIFKELDDRRGIADALRTLGFAASLREDYAKAEQYYTQSMAVYREIDGRTGEAACLINLGEIARKQGQYAEAARYYEEALAINREVGNRYGAAICLNNLGHALIGLGEDDAAWGRLREALRELLVIEAIPVTLEALVGVALLRARAGQFEQAAELLGLVRGHPLVNEETRQYADPALAALREMCAADELETALTRGAAFDLETTVTGLLAGAE